MSKLYETKVVKLQSYSSIELLYLLQDVLKELTDRSGKMNKLHSEMDENYHKLANERIEQHLNPIQK